MKDFENDFFDRIRLLEFLKTRSSRCKCNELSDVFEAKTRVRQAKQDLKIQEDESIGEEYYENYVVERDNYLDLLARKIEEAAVLAVVSDFEGSLSRGISADEFLQDPGKEYVYRIFCSRCIIKSHRTQIDCLSQEDYE